MDLGFQRVQFSLEVGETGIARGDAFGDCVEVVYATQERGREGARAGCYGQWVDHIEGAR